MKKKILSVLLMVILVLSLTACGDDSSEATITDCIDTMTVDGVEDGAIYWTVTFSDEFNEHTFDGLDFYDVIKKCLSRTESKADDVINYSIFAYDSNNTLRFVWGITNDSYDKICEWDENGNREKYEYSLTDSMYEELLEIIEE